jgi:hypothetical protein
MYMQSRIELFVRKLQSSPRIMTCTPSLIENEKDVEPSERSKVRRSKQHKKSKLKFLESKLVKRK